MFAGWVHRQQLDVIDYLKEENRVLREMLGEQRLRLRMHSAGVWLRKPSAWGARD